MWPDCIVTGVRGELRTAQTKNRTVQNIIIYIYISKVQTDNNQEAGEHIPSSEWVRSLWRGSPGRQQADREQPDAKSKERRQVILPGQR